jgi:hypothetical protein
MPLSIVEIHPASSEGELHSEWFVLENVGTALFNSKGCVVAVSKSNTKTRPRQLGSLDPGFVLQPGEKIRVVTGKPPKRQTEGVDKAYYLFLKEKLLFGPGAVLHFILKQNELARATFAPEAARGIAA